MSSVGPTWAARRGGRAAQRLRAGLRGWKRRDVTVRRLRVTTRVEGGFCLLGLFGLFRGPDGAPLSLSLSLHGGWVVVLLSDLSALEGFEPLTCSSVMFCPLCVRSLRISLTGNKHNKLIK